MLCNGGTLLSLVVCVVPAVPTSSQLLQSTGINGGWWLTPQAFIQQSGWPRAHRDVLQPDTTSQPSGFWQGSGKAQGEQPQCNSPHAVETSYFPAQVEPARGYQVRYQANIALRQDSKLENTRSQVPWRQTKSLTWSFARSMISFTFFTPSGRLFFRV